METGCREDPKAAWPVIIGSACFIAAWLEVWAVQRGCRDVRPAQLLFDGG